MGTRAGGLVKWLETVQSKNIQTDLFGSRTEQGNYMDVIDSINRRFGQDIVRPARLKSDISDSPDVIAPAWRPKGYRKSV